MKKWFKIAFVSLVGAGIVATATYFTVDAVLEDIKISEAKNIFVDKIETNKKYKIKNLNLSFFDKSTSHTFSFELENIDLIYENEYYNFNAKIDFNYDFMKVYSGNLTYINDTFYLKTEDSYFTDQNIEFTANTINGFKDSFNSSTLTEFDIFNYNFDINIIESIKENVKHIRTKDKNTNVFESKISKYNSSLMFYTDSEYNLNKLKTSTALEFGNTLLSIDASNISFANSIEITKPQDNYENFDGILNGMSHLFNDFNEQDGKGISLHLGNMVDSTPVDIYYKDRLIFSLIGKLIIYNKTETEDFILHYVGDIKLSNIDIDLTKISASLTLKDDVFYIQLENLSKNSIKMETLEQVFEINKDELFIQIKALLFNLLDIVGINAHFNEDYKLLDGTTASNEKIESVIYIPTTQEDVENQKVTISSTFKDNSFDSLTLSEISYKNIKIDGLSMTFDHQLDEKPIINPEEYRGLDEIFIKLFNFDWYFKLNNILLLT